MLNAQPKTEPLLRLVNQANVVQVRVQPESKAAIEGAGASVHSETAVASDGNVRQQDGRVRVDTNWQTTRAGDFPSSLLLVTLPCNYDK